MNNIPMDAPMALATQQGIKTHTRREIKKIKIVAKSVNSGSHNGSVFKTEDGALYFEHELIQKYSPYKIGQALWVREPARVEHHTLANSGFLMAYRYLSDNKLQTMKVPERFRKLPKWIEKEQGIPNGCICEMARIFIQVTNIRVERLNEISEEDAIKEGVIVNGSKGAVKWYKDYLNKDSCFGNSAVGSFMSLWESIYGDGSFDNRYVLVTEFERISKEEAMSETAT